MRPGGTLVLLLLFSALANAAAQAPEAAPAPPAHARTYPGHESHTTEGMTIAVDPLDTAAKAAQFRTPFLRQGLLVVKVIFSNDNADAIALPNLRVELVKPNHFKAQPLSTDDIFRRIQRPAPKPGDDSVRSRLPIPLPKKQKPRVVSEYEDEVRSLEFMMKAIEPKATRVAYFVFDIAGLDDPLAGAHLYLTGLVNADGQELFFFEVPFKTQR